MTLAVTGVTGQLGGRVARLLAAAGVPQRLVAREPARAPALPGAHTVQAEYADAPAMRAALDGVDTLFLVSGSESPARVAAHLSAVDAAVAAGVSRIVYTSFLGAAADATFTLARDHWATEQYLRASGLGVTVLRDSLYADFLPMMAGPDGVIRGPAGQGRVSAVAQDDIADAAVAVLTEPAAHEDAVYHLTGPQAFTLSEAAAVLTAALGRPFAYHAEGLDEAYASRAPYGAPPWQVDAWVSTYTAIAAGEMAQVSGDVRRLTGRDPVGLEELLRRNG